MTAVARVEQQDAAGERAPLSERACDALVLGFALWTVAAHVTVATGGSLRLLVGLWATLALAVLVIARRAARAAAARAATSGTATSETNAAGQAAADQLAADSAAAGQAAAGSAAATGEPAHAVQQRVFRVVLPLAAAVVCAVVVSTDNVTLGWWAAVVTLGLALAAALTGRDTEPIPARRDRRWEALLWALALAGAVLPLLFHRPNMDDAYYLNVAVAAADDPGAPLLDHDTLFGIKDLPVLLPVYKTQAHELLAGALAWLLPLSAIEAAHLLVPAVTGLFVALAGACLCRLLTPRTWIATTAVALVVLVAAGESYGSHASGAFVKLHQGKGLLSTILVPLIVVYAARFAVRPGARPWWLLFAAQVAAVGANASGIWIGPTVAGSALLVALGTGRPRRLFLGLAASAYPIAIGLGLRAAMSDIMTQFVVPNWSMGQSSDPLILMHEAWTLAMGTGAFALLGLFAMLATGGLVRRGLPSTLAVALPLAFLVVLFNPYTAGLLATNVTNTTVYYRALWVLPIPILVAVVLTTPLRLDRGWPFVRGLACAAVVTAFVLFVPTASAIDEVFDVRYEPFGLNVWPEPYAAAARLARLAPPGAPVLAPREVSLWVGTFHGHPDAVVPRVDYLEFLKPYVPVREIARRRIVAYALNTVAEQPANANTAGVLAGVDAYAVVAVCLPATAEDTGLPRDLLARGFRRADGPRGYIFFTRGPPR